VRTRWFALAALLPCAANAQSTATEWWPELDVYHRPAEHQRSFLELSASAEREASKRDASIGLYQDYLWLPGGFARGGYRFTFSTRDASYRESRFVGEVTLAVASSARYRLLNRLRGELRSVNREWSYRVRERLHFQRTSQAARGFRAAPYITCEPYYDSRYHTIARIGGRVGVEGQLGGPVSIDVYVARQDNSRGVPSAVNALGVTTRLSY
jgi:hypothetical protein